MEFMHVVIYHQSKIYHPQWQHLVFWSFFQINHILDKLFLVMFFFIQDFQRPLVMNGMTGWKLNSKAIYVNNITDLNNPPKCPILDTKINPIGLPSGLGSNACFVIQQNLGTGNYTAQLAFSFRHDKIAIRRKSNTDSWTEWKYFTAQ